MSSPYRQRDYYPEFSREEDERLADELFQGTLTKNKKTGRVRHDYLPADGPDERRAIEALQRLLLSDCGDLDIGILAAIVSSFNRDGSFGRRLVFEPRKREPKKPEKRAPGKRKPGKRKRRGDSTPYLRMAV